MFQSAARSSALGPGGRRFDEGSRLVLVADVLRPAIDALLSLDMTEANAALGQLLSDELESAKRDYLRDRAGDRLGSGGLSIADLSGGELELTPAASAEAKSGEVAMAVSEDARKG